MGKVQVLLVDDDPLALSLIHGILASSRLDATFLTAGGAAEAMALCETHMIDCAVIDYEMPDVDGLELSRRLRAQIAHLPIILCTGAGDELLAAEALRGGVSDYIPKTRISTEALYRSITNAIELSSRQRTIDDQRAELETFAVALAHDFKQPIRQIVTFADLIARETQALMAERPDKQGGRLPQLLQFMSDAASRLDQLVDVMSQYTLLREAPEVSAVSVTGTVSAVVAGLETYIAERGASVHVMGEGVVRANQALLAQILQNLIANGIKYNASPAPRIDIAIYPAGSEIGIEVRDNGIGIGAEYLDYIFQPLARLHTRREYEGSGLGLTLARKAVLAQGGTISCASQPGDGSTFSVRLPAMQAMPVAA
ncbi:MAG TPA: ATP-binding protein [Novosphingobium sp.]|nr:ATP-binding protein [Novosphingobium sp.]